MTLFCECHPVAMQYRSYDMPAVLADVERLMLENGLVKNGDLVVITVGEPVGKSGGTNNLKIVRIGSHS